MSQITQDPLAAGREAIGRLDWIEGYELLRTADETMELAPEDLMLLGEAAMWNGQMEMVHPYFERAYRGYLQQGNMLRAAYVATWIAHNQKNNLQASVANGWMSRAKRLLDLEEEAPEHGYWALQKSLLALSEHNFAESLALSKQAEELGRRFGDRNLEIRALQRQGNVLIEQGEVAEGKLLLDEASAAALAGELDPFSTLVVYCNTIGACRDVADFESAGEWTDRASEFCDANAMTAFPGMCRVNHAEVMKFKGRLGEAQLLANRAGEELRGWNPRIAGAAFYELGEVRPGSASWPSEKAFREADGSGGARPGSAHRLAQGNAKERRPIRRRWERIAPVARPRASAYGSRRIAVRPGERRRRLRRAPRPARGHLYSSALRAVGRCAGQVALERGEDDAAFKSFARARMTWDSTERPTRGPRAGAVGKPCAPGDEEAAVWELQAAAARFERLGAVRDADRVAELLMRDVSTDVLKTFLFTDIVGSTELASAVASDRHWVNLLRRHDDALRAIFADFNGQVVDHTGDGFFAAFEEAADALGAAVAVQRAVDQEFEFDIRIGVHTDGALQTRKSYHGKACTPLHASARASGREDLRARRPARAAQVAGQTNEPSPQGLKEPVEVWIGGLAPG